MERELKTIHDVIGLGRTMIHFAAELSVHPVTVTRWLMAGHIPEKYHGPITDKFNTSLAELRHVNKLEADRKAKA